MSYPRPGQSLVPALLHWVFASEVPQDLVTPPLPSGMQLCDVDWAILRELTPLARMTLVDHVVSCARTSLGTWPSGLLAMELEVPAGLELQDLDLGNRTFNCLGRVGLDESFHRLTRFSLGDLLAIPGFGAACLLELLWALEWAIATGSSVLTGPSQAAWERLDALLQAELLSSGDSCGQPSPDVVEANARAGRYLRNVAEWIAGELGLQRKVEATSKRLLDSVGSEGISPRDPRLGALVRGLPSRDTKGATLQERLKLVIEYPGQEPHSQRSVLGALERLQSAIDHMMALSLEDELEVLLMPAGRRNRDMVQKRVGLYGDRPATLDDIGREYGLTRERVRQIVAKAIGRFDGYVPYAPRLDASLRVTARTVPALGEDVEVALQQAGMSRGTIRLDGLLSAARILGRRNPGFARDGILVVGRSLDTKNATGSARIISEARKAVSHWGMTTFADIAAVACEGWDETMALRAVKGVLRTREDFRLLDEDTGWFFLMETARNSLTTRMAKILSVASPIHVSELRVGVGRHYRARGFAPPQRVLLRLCEYLPGYAVDGSLVLADPPLDWNHVLAGVEWQLADVLFRSGGIMRRTELEEKACVLGGMNKSTFYVNLDNSPIICRYAPGVYGLRGVPVQPGVVEELAARGRRRRTRVLVDHGWTRDGAAWIGYRLSPSLISSGVFAVPSGLRRILDGQYSLTTPDDAHVGTLVIQAENPSGWGLSPLFRRRGGEPGDYLLLVFDLTTHTARASLGDETVLESPSGTAAVGDALPSKQQGEHGLHGDEEERDQLDLWDLG